MERETLRELYERYGHHVLARCRYLLRDEEAARDAMQDVFLRALENGAAFRGEAQPTTWLVRIATNHCLNLVRNQRNATRRAVAEGRVEIPGPGELWSVDRAERRELVRDLLQHIQGEAAEVAVLYFVDELTQEEIGAAVGRSLPTVRKRLREFTDAAEALLSERRAGPAAAVAK